MIKFVLIMYLCSGVANDCRRIPTALTAFDSYRDCGIYGYQHTVNVLKAMPEEHVNEWKIYTRFKCQENSSSV
tara:strand:- start:981 stop:1199 length:219 start_codon:yes stop_codon:yes gene_type:complete